MKRDAFLAAAREREEPFDFIVIGGGATGAGVAVDAATRGFEVLLVEALDFGSGTSSRSTKLVHGGVRYLAQGRIGLVHEALRERALMLKNAPHLVSVLPILVPAANRLELARYWIGLKLYDWLAGTAGFGPSRFVSRDSLEARMPEVADAGLAGAIEYFDGQFDDARCNIALVQTAADNGAVVLNYCALTGFIDGPGGRVQGITIEDAIGGASFDVSGRVIVNATGPYADSIRRLDDPDVAPRIAPSQGVHLVVDRRFLPGDDGLLIPKTSDGRIMFALPWNDHVILGTTDTPLDETPRAPVARDDEVAMILETVARYLNPAPTRADVLAVNAGIRPLPKLRGQSTAETSRKHTVDVAKSGLVSITGGKWTTYRNMAEDCVNRAIASSSLERRPCVTRSWPLHGALPAPARAEPLSIYGSDAAGVRALGETDPALAERLHPDLPYTGAECVWAAREEMAMTLEDVLARRTRALFLNARAASDCAPAVARLVGAELGWDEQRRDAELERFRQAMRGYAVAGR